VAALAPVPGLKRQQRSELGAAFAGLQFQQILKAGDGNRTSATGISIASFHLMYWIDLIQWPAMTVTLVGAWLVASQRKFKRNWGFWVFLLSNALWIVWGLHDRAYALILLQVCLAFANIRGIRKTEEAKDPGQHELNAA
jgi:hypothetical protein